MPGTGTSSGVTNLGPRTWSLDMDKDGYSDYHITLLLKTDEVADGPYVVSTTPNIPGIGATWAYGNDSNPYATLWPDSSLKPYGQVEGDPHFYWLAELHYSDRPFKRCKDETFTNPLLEPIKYSGSFANYTRKTRKDRNGKAILSSSQEIVPVTRDDNRPSITVEQNVALLQLSLFTSMIDTLNNATLWGLPKRTIKLSNVAWNIEYYGVCCAYYKRRMTFDIRYPWDDASWDYKDIPDAGYMQLQGKWGPATGADVAVWGKEKYTISDAGIIARRAAGTTKKGDFVRIEDCRGQYNKDPTALDGTGVVNPNPLSDPKFLSPAPEIYGESNFLLLGVPLTF